MPGGWGTRGFGALAVGVAALLALAPAAWSAPIVVIQEVCYDGAASDAGEAFTELYGTPGASLEGWALVGMNGADGLAYRTLSLTGATLGLDGLLVIATSSATGAVLAARGFTANVDWQNGPDAIWLLGPDGTIVDALAYGSGAASLGEGNPAVDVSAGSSLSRDLWGSDTQDNLYDFAVTAFPTPGSLGGISPSPEPLTCLLVGGGAVGLVQVKRRKARSP